MQGVLAATTAKFVEFKPIRIVAAVLFCGVVTFLAFVASQVNHHPNIFLSHFPLILSCLAQQDQSYRI
jgi:pterin-4a-carbinolamine dehydratase